MTNKELAERLDKVYDALILHGLRPDLGPLPADVLSNVSSVIAALEADPLAEGWIGNVVDSLDGPVAATTTRICRQLTLYDEPSPLHRRQVVILATGVIADFTEMKVEGERA